MNSDRVFTLIERAAALRGNEKTRFLEEHRDDAMLKDVFYRAYSPFTTYGIAKVPVAGKDYTPGTGQFGPAEYALLAGLADRTVTGNNAKDALFTVLSSLTLESGTLLLRIITKDLRCGITATTANKVWPGLIPTFDCALAQPFEAKRWKQGPRLVSPKLDGLRCLAVVRQGQVQLFSRNGKEFTSSDHLKEPLRQLAAGLSIVFDGELLSSSFLESISSVRKKNAQDESVHLHIFDAMTLQAFEDRVCNAPLADRLEFLQGNLPWQDGGPLHFVEHEVAISVDHALDLTKRYWDMGLEGSVVKDPEAPYEFRRSWSWQKIKAQGSVDVKVIDAVEGTGKYVGMLGALVVDVDGVAVNVGSGLTDAQRQEFWQDKDALLGKVVEVAYHERTPDGSLRHPRLKAVRPDKEAA